MNCLKSAPIPVYGTGENIRDWLYVEDHAQALLRVLSDGRPGETYNIGGNSENYQVRQLADFVQQTIPNCEISFAGNASADLRNYRVNFDKFEKTFPDFALQWNALDGARSIYDSYAKFGLDKDDYEGPKYKRIAQLKSLIESGQLDDTMRWT